MRLWPIVALLLPAAAHAAPEPCGVEPTERSRVVCLRAMVETERAALDGYLAGATADLVPATGAALRAFEAALRASQRDWRRRTDAACGAAADPVAVERCRLDATLRRAAQVRVQMRRARERLGLAPLIEMPRDVEILVPLPAPPGGPPVETRLPLHVPIPAD